MADASRLDALSLGFRSRYLGYEELTRQVHAWAEAFPSIVRLESLAVTPEERHLWLLTIGPDPDRTRPAVWIDGNMHASELAGSSVALAIAEDLIRAHLAPGAALGLPAEVIDHLRAGVVFHVLPRMCPDGAERLLTLGAYVRSNPRDRRLGRTAPYWKAGDVDGDGRARLMRRKDPAGDFVASAEIPGLMLPRTIEDPGPYYAIYPEGTIENWDGFTVPADSFLSDNETDLNRNFPYSWAPEPRQIGAGPYAASEPESRAVTEFAVRHPNIFAWLNLHTFGGCYIRPPGDRPDRKMNPAELAVFRQIGEWTERIAGYPTVGGFDEFTYEPDTPLCGDLSTFAHAQRGAVGLVCELWDFWKQAGVEVLRPFVLNYTRRTREDIHAIARWDREHNDGRVVGAWKPFDHPQLGPVEIGGYDPRIGIWNPPPDRLPEVCENQARVLFRIAAMTPRLRVGSIDAAPLGEGLVRVTAIVENVGYLPTYVLPSAKAFPWNDPVRARLDLEGALDLASDPADHLVGHLEGWGRYEAGGTPSFARTESAPTRARVSWVVRVKGKGRVSVVAGASRVGKVEASVELG